ncbi:DUF4350 domain-containing protein [Myceligenerans pegani]|uniref:DUF4350 domain-containing protein n=1 Tax=Myceligenerans pegani TaxID=2776917 RepID=A0ABR9MY96_9MICO|nr:DUF4350 domain-containing protein [Myceligenerans sp. TRM 65318]MBE1876349.1 DUF4350 domain-containing protein [Myceligenerans sp. TRM 65318]MBE3018620.1 DUF4350 domain-containing protein [Myceligenerans sp. TRM 65318]
MTTTQIPTPPPAVGPRPGGGTGTDVPVVVGRPARRGFSWKTVGWIGLVMAAIGLFLFVLAFTRPTGSDIPYSTGNPDDDGGRAVAEVLGDHGVTVNEVRTVRAAFDGASAGETLVVTPHPAYFEPGQIEALAAIESDVVLLAPSLELLDAFTDGRVEEWYAGPAAPGGPQCAAPAARAAQDVRLETGLSVVEGTADSCWPAAAGDGFAYVRLQADGRWVHVIYDPSLIRNDTVLDGGHAALALWTLGAHDELTWLVPDLFDTTMLDGPPGGGEAGRGDGGDSGAPRPEASPGSVLPQGTGPVVWILLLTGLVLAIWRARRLGPLVTEPLPVLVRSAETMRGRARLYRAVGARGHAAAGLRASAAHRMAQRLGLARSADATAVTDAVAGATRRSTDEVARLLYGPPPADDGELTELARSLDNLESEVHRS